MQIRDYAVATPDKPASVGAVHIVGEDGEELPAGEPGEVFFESPATFEYLNDAEKTASSRHEKAG